MMEDRDIDSALAQLYMDVIFIEEIGFLAYFLKPMDLIVASFGVDSETLLHDALFGHYHAYCSGGFTISTVVMDGESAVINIADMINVPKSPALA